MKPRLYFDTSVFGGIYDSEFEEVTVKLFEMVKRGDIICVFSELTETELKNAPKKVIDYFLKLPKEYTEYIEVTEEAYLLADMYIKEKVVGKTSLDDCRHIATATIHKVDYLVSWNFKHIVNLDRIKGYNSVNMRLGYAIIEIRSPKDLINYEDD